MSGQLISLPDAAKTLGVSRNRIYSLARDGTIPGVVRLGERQLRIDQRKLEQFIDRGGVPQLDDAA